MNDVLDLIIAAAGIIGTLYLGIRNYKLSKSKQQFEIYSNLVKDLIQSRDVYVRENNHLREEVLNLKHRIAVMEEFYIKDAKAN